MVNVIAPKVKYFPIINAFSALTLQFLIIVQVHANTFAVKMLNTLSAERNAFAKKVLE